MTFQHALAILVWITTFDTAQSEPIWRTILPNGPSQTIKTPVNPKEQAIQIIFPPPLTAGTKTAHVEFDFYTSLNVLLHNTHRPNISVIINLETGNNKLGGRFHFSHDDMTCSKSFGSMIPTEDRITFTLTSLKFYMESGITIDLGEEANCEIKEEPIKFQSTDLFYFRVRYVEYRQEMSSGHVQEMRFGVVSNRCGDLPRNVATDSELPVEIGKSIIARCTEGYTNQAAGESVVCIGGMFDETRGLNCKPDCTHLDSELEMRGVKLSDATFPVKYGTSVSVKCANETLDLKGDISITCHGGSQFVYENKPRCEVDWKRIRVNQATDFIRYDPRNEVLQMRFFNESLVDSFYVVVFLYEEKLKRQLQMSEKTTNLIFSLGDVMSEKLDDESSARLLITSLTEEFTDRHISYLGTRQGGRSWYLYSDGASTSSSKEKSQIMTGSFGEVMKFDLTGTNENDIPEFVVGETTYRLESASLSSRARDKNNPIQWLKIVYHEHSTYSFYTETADGTFPDIFYSVTKKESPYEYQNCTALPVELELDDLKLVHQLPVAYGTKVKITCQDRVNFDLKGDALITCDEGTNFSYSSKPWCISDWSKFDFSDDVSGFLEFNPKEEVLQFGFQKEFLEGNDFDLIIYLFDSRDNQQIHSTIASSATIKVKSQKDRLSIEGRLGNDPSSVWTIDDAQLVLQSSNKNSRKRDIPHMGESISLDLTSEHIYSVGGDKNNSSSHVSKYNKNFQKFSNLTHKTENPVQWIRISFKPAGNSQSGLFYYSVVKKECSSLPGEIETDSDLPLWYDTIVSYNCKPWYEPIIDGAQLKCRGDYFVHPKNDSLIIDSKLCRKVKMGQLGIWITISTAIILSVAAIIGSSRYWRAQNLKKASEEKEEKNEENQDNEKQDDVNKNTANEI